MFFNAGFVVSLMDSGFYPIRYRVWVASFHAATLFSIPLGFFGILNWMVFGPGDESLVGASRFPFSPSISVQATKFWAELCSASPLCCLMW
jgi:hypothetical protein